MVDLDYLKRCGCSSGNYKKLFTLEPPERPRPLQRLIDLLASRAREGIRMSLTEWKAIAAIDLAYDVPFAQSTPTLVQNILSQRLDAVQTRKALKDWGLCEDDLFLKIEQPNGQYMLQINRPVFFQIFIPLVKAYVTIRLSKIFNERNTQPLLPYKPLKQTDRNRVACEIVTDLIETIATQYGYSSVMRQAIQQMLKYGICLSFPREEWHSETQVLDGSEVTIKEGIRYLLPHPTRMFYDLKHPLTTLNSDTGCEFAGNWHVMAYSDILDNRDWWNRKAIFCGTNWFSSPLAGQYFTEVYPCVMDFPMAPMSAVRLRDEKQVAYSPANDRDKSVFVTNQFAKIIPSAFGLGSYRDGKLEATYNYPVWHRFTMAGYDTVIWAEPCAYNPVWFMGYDYDEQTSRTPSMALECIPFQDHLGNILSQMILTAKQNLANVTFYDQNMVDPEEIQKLKNSGEQQYRSTNWMPYDGMKWSRQGLNPQAAFIPQQLQKQNVQEMMQMIPIILNIMERVLQISAQEAGTSATHQQSKYELERIGGASTNRIALTCSYVDEGLDAWRKQLFDAAVAYKDPTVLAQVSPEIPDLPKRLEELGFNIVSSSRDKVLVTGHKSGLRLESFSRFNVGYKAEDERQISQIIFQTVGVIAAQPMIFQVIGADAVVKLLEQAALLAGAPRDFKLKPMPGPAPAAPGQGGPDLKAMVDQVQQSIMQAVEQKFAAPAAKAVAEDQQKIAQLEQVVTQLQRIYQVASAAQDKAATRAQETEHRIQLRNAESQAEQKRKDAELAADLERKRLESEAKIAQEAERTLAEIDLKQKAAKAGGPKKRPSA